MNEEIERLSRVDYYPPQKRIGVALKTISTLRARLESADAESADFQRLSEARFQRNNALECLNKEQEADIASLRTRLESVEAARRDAQESRFGLIVENEELGADLVAIRDRLESVEAALKEARGLIGDLYDNGCWNDAQVTEIQATCARLDAALGAAGERSEG